MATIIEMPKLSDTMESGTLVSWKKQEGDPISPGEVIAEIESDKATMELEAFDAGFLRRILVKVGDPAPIGGALAIISETPDEDISTLLAGGRPGTPDAAPPKAAEPQSITASAPKSPDAQPPSASSAPGRISASPLAARMAQEAGLDLSQIPGSGPEGRIVKRDIERAQAEGMVSTRPVGMIPAAPLEKIGHPELEYEDIPNSSMRRVIAQRLTESTSQIPHYYVTIEIDMRQATGLRKQLNALEGVKISLNDFVIKAAALALEKHPLVNASFQGSHIRVYHRIDMGVAVAMPEGLITPVIRNANRKGLRQISQEARGLAERARNKQLRSEEYSGSTFTVSNLGMLGVKHFTAVINPPEAAILAVGATRETPVVENGQITIGQRMEVTMSSDHRVIDGAQSARFLETFKYYLENPITFAL